jgi:hypothetical protein
MTYLRNTGLRQLIAIAFLISGLLVQVQTLYACQLMDDGPKSTCCCGVHMKDGCAMGGGCDSGPGAMAMDCCDVTVEVELQDVAVAQTTAAKLITQLDAPRPPPAVAISTEFNFALPDNSTLLEPRVDRLSWSSGTHTYLMTSRLRI